MPYTYDTRILYNVLRPYLRDALLGSDPAAVRLEVAVRDTNVEVKVNCHVTEELARFIFFGHRRALGEHMELIDACMMLSCDTAPSADITIRFTGVMGTMLISDLLKVFKQGRLCDGNG